MNDNGKTPEEEDKASMAIAAMVAIILVLVALFIVIGVIVLFPSILPPS